MKIPHILLRSSWQTVNIGDIAHTPGMLALLEQDLPEARITLWPNHLSSEVESLLQQRFPQLSFLGDRNQEDVIAECDFALHGSGPGLVGVETMKSWAATGKPYGFGGVTLSDEEITRHHDLLQNAKFLFCRDTLSVQAAREAGLKADFFPDATFFLDLKNDIASEKFCAHQGLEHKKFACFIPRLRWTPYWKEKKYQYSPETIAEKEAENAAYAEVDHGRMRDAIVAWVRETGLKALLCPEMSYQTSLLEPLLYDPLPNDVKPFVVMRSNYWLTDEAASTYARAAAVLSLECHSPIMAMNNGTPGIYLRQPTDTRKGQMYRDIGLQDCIFEIDEASGQDIAVALLGLLQPKALDRLEAARSFVEERGQHLIEAIRAS